MNVDPIESAGLPVLDLGPLDEPTSRDLLTLHAPGLPVLLQERLLREAAGNPLALIELPRAMSATDVTDDPIAAPLPVTARLERSFGTRLDGLPELTRTVLLVASADGQSVLSEVLSASGSPCLDRRFC